MRRVLWLSPLLALAACGVGDGPPAATRADVRAVVDRACAQTVRLARSQDGVYEDGTALGLAGRLQTVAEEAADRLSRLRTSGAVRMEATGLRRDATALARDLEAVISTSNDGNAPWRATRVVDTLVDRVGRLRATGRRLGLRSCAGIAPEQIETVRSNRYRSDVIGAGRLVLETIGMAKPLDNLDPRGRRRIARDVLNGTTVPPGVRAEHAAFRRTSLRLLDAGVARKGRDVLEFAPEAYDDWYEAYVRVGDKLGLDVTKGDDEDDGAAPKGDPA